MKKNICNKIIKKIWSSIIAEYLISLLIIFILFLGAFYLVDKTPRKVIWYGIPYKVSMSGDFRFYPSNEKGQRFEGHWFWAIPKDTDDVENIKKIYRILEQQGVYKITGIRNKDDCSYYKALEEVGNFPCIASLTLLDIVRVGTTTNKYPISYWGTGVFSLSK